MTNRLNCGAEHGLNVSGGATTANQRHWFFNNTVAIDTTVYRSGAKSFRLDSAVTPNSMDHTFLVSTDTVIAGVFFFRTDSVAPATTARIHAITLAGGTSRFDITTGGVLQMNLGAGAASGPTLSANTFYGVEYEIDVSANPWTGSWRTWDAGTWTNRSAPTSRALAASTVGSVRMDNQGVSGVTATGITLWFDDMSFGTSTAAGTDYGATASDVRVLRYRPNADGTHSFAANDFRYGSAGANILTSATDVYTYVDDDDQTSLADFIAQRVVNASGYIELQFEDEATYTSPRGLTVVQSHHASTTGTDSCTTKISDDGFTSSTDLWTNDDVSDTTIHQRGRTVDPPSGGAWTTAKVNSTRIRWGYSSDVVGEPYLDSIALEVAWNVQPVGVVTAYARAAQAYGSTPGKS